MKLTIIQTLILQLNKTKYENIIKIRITKVRVL